jgi:hypothetical protein
VPSIVLSPVTSSIICGAAGSTITKTAVVCRMVSPSRILS